MTYTLTIPMLPPTANHIWLLNRNGSRRLTESVLTFRLLVKSAVQHVAPWVQPGCDLELCVALTFGDRRTGDVDNRIKSAGDALALALGFDDKQIGSVRAWRAGYDKGSPQTVLTLAPWAGALCVALSAMELQEA